MGARWTAEQVLALAPDGASAKAARGLASPRTWSELGSTEALVWGRCQGSGKAPYQVTVELAEPAFKCSCPSRKFPCKHALALLLMWAHGQDWVGDDGAASDFAADWAARRADRAAQAAARAAAPPKPVDPEAQARAADRRAATMSAGLDDFERWLLDLVRQGLAAARRQPFSFWDAAAARLVDAQLPGLAERVRAAGMAVHTRADWADHLLAELGRWYLAVRAWRRREALDDALLSDLRVVLGWPRKAEEVAAGERVGDRWTAIGRRLGGDERLRSQRTWLRGEATGETVVVLDFAAAGAALPVAQVVGTVVEAELALYPGGRPRRALFTGEAAIVAKATAIPAAVDVDAALEQVADVLASNPWADRVPVALARAVPFVAADGAPWLADPGGRRLPLAPDPDPWLLLALTGGHPVDLFGEWEDGRLHATTLAVDGELVPL